MDAGSAEANSSQAKAATGIRGFDEITRGGLPQGRTTLLVGGPGSGKTIFALQFLVHGAVACNEPGIFVAFEETPERVIANFAGFGVGLAALQPQQLFFLNAQPELNFVQSGTFDMEGMLAGLTAKVKAMGARRIIFDALDMLLMLLPDGASRRREVHRIHRWLVAHQLTGLITAKEEKGVVPPEFGFMQYMVDCAVVLNHQVVLGVSQRNLRVLKYRGSGFDENESPFVIGKHGFDVAIVRELGHVEAVVTNERITSGVDRLDTMLGGGYYRGSSVLITGFTGTAKTTLSGAFVDAACGRDERTLYVGFDSDASEVIRNLASVGLRLQRHVDSGMLRMVSARTLNGSAETLLVRIKTLATEHQARCLVIDPVTMLSKSGNENTAHSVAERLLDWTKSDGITLVCTSPLDEMIGQTLDSGTPLHISSLADTWIHLSYVVQAGERNRGMSIVKSRGTAHSNQVRELILSNEGVTLADIYTAGGEVLMGTMRWEKESAERVAKDVAEVAAELNLVRLDAEEAVLEVRAKSLNTELKAKQLEKKLLSRSRNVRESDLAEAQERMRELRGGDSLVDELAESGKDGPQNA